MLSDFLKIRNLHDEMTVMLQNSQFIDKANGVTYNLLLKYLQEKYNEKKVLQWNNEKSFIRFVYDKLMEFYDEDIENESINHGFYEL